MKTTSHKSNKKIKEIVSHPLFFPFFLLVIQLVTFGILTPWIGFYGDDWALIWNGYRMQNQDWIAFRPLVVFIYDALSTVLGPSFAQWQIVSITFRWLGGVALLGFLRQLLPKHRREARLFTLCYVLYPGFVLYAPLTNIAPFVQPIFLFLSFYFTLIWLRSDLQKGLYLVLSLVFAAINLLITEYYFFFEFFRPLIILYALQEKKVKQKLLQALKLWLPHVIVLLGVTIWRIYEIRVNSPYNSNFSRMLSQPIQFLLNLWQKALHDFEHVIIKPLISVFTFPVSMGPRTLFLFGAVVGCVLLGTFLYFLISWGKNENRKTLVGINPFLLILLGLVAFLFAGLPFWIADLEVAFVYSGLNRMAIPHAVGFSLLLLGILLLVLRKNRVVAIIIFSLFLGLFAGNQFKAADNFRAKWDAHEKFFYEFAWRIPQLKPGTIIILNPSGIGDNALAAALNWHYVDQQDTDHLDYYFYQDDDHLLNDIPDIEPGQEVSNYHISGTFHGNTSNVLVLHVEENACLRVVDPNIDIYNPDITDFSRDYIQYSNDEVISATTYLGLGSLDESIHNGIQQTNWCYFFQKADLARQMKDWEAVADMAEEAFSLDEHAGHASELLPFIEGYAHISDWERAKQITTEVINISSQYARMTCAVWDRIDDETKDTQEKTEVMEWVDVELNCADLDVH